MRLAPDRQPPPLWCFLCQDWLGLSRTQALRWWGVLSASQSPRAVAVRSAVLCNTVLGETPASLEHLVGRTVSPRVLIEMTEDLVREGERLTRAQANRVEEAILGLTTAAGDWKAEGIGTTDATDR